MARQNLSQYSINKVFLNIDGLIVNSGLAKGKPIATHRLDEDEWTMEVGAQGDFTFVEHTNKAGSIDIITMQNAADINLKLRNLKESGAIFPVSISAQHTYKEIVPITFAMIGRAPRKDFSQEAGERLWTIICGELIETDKGL